MLVYSSFVIINKTSTPKVKTIVHLRKKLQKKVACPFKGKHPRPRHGDPMFLHLILFEATTVPLILFEATTVPFGGLA